MGRSVEQLEFSDKAEKSFPYRATQHFIDLINKDDPEDPLLKQILPVVDELYPAPGFINDPLEEKNYQPVPGLLHKYQGRVLLITTGKCAIHCRYCFRRHFPYPESNRVNPGLDQALEYINEDSTLSEVILSGGDPLTLSDKYLEKLIRNISSIKHIKFLRIHSRIPVVLPSRVTDKFIDLFESFPNKKILVVHVNHPNELGKNTTTAMKKLRKSDIHLFNQSVLLNGINNDSGILMELSRKLFNLGIIPYYIHMPDKVEGTSHFAVEEKAAKNIMAELSSRLPGYLVPRLVKEIPGASYKIPIEILEDQ